MPPVDWGSRQQALSGPGSMRPRLCERRIITQIAIGTENLSTLNGPLRSLPFWFLQLAATFASLGLDRPAKSHHSGR